MITRTPERDLGYLRPYIRIAATFEEALARLVSLTLVFCLAALPCDAKSAVSLDLLNADRSQDDLLRPYMTQLRQRIQSNWRLEKRAERATKVYFEIGGSGELSTIRVANSSGDSAVDRCSLKAVSACGPFQPPPRSSAGTLNIVATFRNNLQAVEAAAARPDFVVHVEHGAYSKNRFRAEGTQSQERATGEGDDWEDEHSSFASSRAEVAQTLSTRPPEREETSSTQVRTLASSIPVPSSRPYSGPRAAPTSSGRWNPTVKRKLEPWEEELLRSRSNFVSSTPTQKQAAPQSLKPKVPRENWNIKYKPAKNAPAVKEVRKRTTGYMQPTASFSPPKSKPTSVAPPANSLPPITPDQTVSMMPPPPVQAAPDEEIAQESEARASGFSIGKDDSAFPWWLLIGGALIAAGAYGIRAMGTHSCPFCAEPIKRAAVVCKHCNSKLKEPVNEMTSS